jgi:tetratricopeptide (TPR) repeat protein
MAILVAASVGLGGCFLLKRRPKEADLLESGRRYFEQKDYSRAIIQFKNASRANPNDAEPLYQLGVTYLKTGDTQSAVNHLLRATELNPKHADAQLKLAELMAGNKDLKVVADTRKRVDEILKVSPENPDALNALAIAESRLQHHEEASRILDRALRKSPQHINSTLTLAMLKASKGDLAGARELVKKLETGSPRSPDTYLAVARFYWVLGAAKEIEASVRKALEIDPRNGPALAILASTLVRQRRIEEAEQVYLRLATLPDREFRGYYGAYLLHTGKPEAASAEFGRLLKLDPSDRQLRSQLVRADLAAGRLEDANRLLSDALRQNEKDVDALLQRAEIWVAAGKLGDAQKDLVQVLRLKPDSAEGRLALARVYGARGMTRNQRQELTDALKYDPRLLNARIGLSRNLIAAGTPAAALDVMEQAPRDQQQLAEYLTERNAALMGLNEWTAARKGIDEGLALIRSHDLLLQDALYRLKHLDFAGSRASLNEAMKSPPPDARLAEAYAISFAAQKQMPAALAHLREFAARWPRYAGAQQLLGRWLLQAGDTAGARPAFEAALAADPGSAQAVVVLADLDEEAGKQEQARQRLERFLAAHPDSIAAQLKLASLDDKAGNAMAAVGRYRQVLSADPNSLAALNNLAYRLANDFHQADEALQFAQRAKELAPESAVVEDTLGWVLYQKGLYSTAILQLESAVRRQSTASRQYHLAMAYLKKQDYPRADQALRAALQHNPKMPEALSAQSSLRSAMTGKP